MGKDLGVLILGAGYGTRMKSDIPKVLHLFDGKPIIINILEEISRIENIKGVVIVVGYKGELVVDEINKWKKDKNIRFKIDFVQQKLLKGSGRAVLESSSEIKHYKNLLVMAGDVPAINSDTLKDMYEAFLKKQLSCVILTAVLEDTKSYGRIIRDETGNVCSIVEKSELKEEQEKIKEINSGIYIFKTDKLLKHLRKLKPKGPKKEYYLTDVIENLYGDKEKIDTYIVNDEIEITGVNSKLELIDLEKKVYKKRNYDLLNSGVIIKDVDNVCISKGISIKKDTLIYPYTFIKGETSIGKNCVIGQNVIIEDSIIEDDCFIDAFCYIRNSRIRKGSKIGPFTHIRPESDIGPEAKIGNFSEIKKSRIRRGSKVPHLSYIGDTDMGEKVNVGAGTITCNYDGIKKHKTVIHDGAFIGSNTNLVAPVKVGRNVLIGAGSTITEDIPDNKLAIARARQVIKDRKR